MQTTGTISNPGDIRALGDADVGSRRRRLARRALRTESDARGLVARVTLGAVLLPHGAQHLLGWFGGFGLEGTRGWMVTTLGVPSAVATAAIVLELVAPLLLVVGLGGRFAAAWLAGFLAVAASTHAKVGFFMN